MTQAETARRGASVGRDRIREILEAELHRDVLPEAHACADHARSLHGDRLGPILFYGSCQRAESAEGILDLYLLTKGNRAFHDRAVMAGLNWLVPPNIYFYSLPNPLGQGERDADDIRAKVAAISEAQFGASCRDETPSPSIWARFCQPAVLLWSPDERATESVIQMMVDAVLTAARWAAHLGPREGTARDYWVALFRATYRVELRPERQDRAALIYDTHPERYDALLPAAWEALGIPFDVEGDRLSVHVTDAKRRDAERRWGLRAAGGKGISLARIAKGAFTFDGGVDYLLWKIQRHSGVELEVTEWQRRHPFLASPVVIAQLLRSGAIR